MTTTEETKDSLRAELDRLRAELEQSEHRYVRLHTAVVNGLSLANSLDQRAALERELAAMTEERDAALAQLEP